MISLKISDFARVVTGGTPSTMKKEFWDGGTIPWLNSGELNQDILTLSSNYITEQGLRSSNAKMMPPDTVLVALTGATTGKVGYLTFEACANQSVSGILPSPNHHPKYLYYFLLSQRKKILGDSYGGAQKHISQSYVQNIKVPLPDLPIQKKIAAILDKADSLRQKDKQLLEHYNKLAQSIFYDMFGDPIRNEKGWDKPPFGSIGESRLGKMLDSKKQNGGAKYPYLGNSNVKWGLIDFSNLKEMEFTDDERIEFQLKDGDLLICEGGEVGRCAIWRNEQPNVYFQKAIHRVRLHSERAMPEYVQFVFQHYGQHNGFKDFVTVATIAHLTGIKLRQVPVPVPPIELQRKFSTLIQNVLHQRKKAEENLIKTESLFQTLLKKAFKGELVKGS